MKPWLLYAFLGALFAGLMPIFVKRGLVLPDGKMIDSNLATAIRVVMLIVPVWFLVWQQGHLGQALNFTPMNWVFLALSAAATGLSWLFQFKALQYADVSRVMPIDKMSLVIAVIVAVLFLGEVISLRLVVAIALITAGTILAIPTKSSAQGAATTNAATTGKQDVEQPGK